MFNWQHIRFREPLADAFRNTAAVVLPLLLLYKDHRESAVGVAVGALLISLTDLPGNRGQKTVTAIRNICAFFLVTVLFSFCTGHALLCGVALVILSFVLPLLAAFGARSAVTGTMSAALMIFILGLRRVNPLAFSLYILAGSCWYYAISLLQVWMFPFRSLQQALREALLATAGVLDAKELCYDTAVPLDAGYRRTIALHLQIAQKQEVVRQLVLSDRYAIRKRSTELQHLLNASIRIIELYELVTAMHYDYAGVRIQLDNLNILTNTRELIRLLADEARKIGEQWPHTEPVAPDLSGLTAHLRAVLSKLPLAEAAVVRGILTNTAAVRGQLTAIREHRSGPMPAEPAVVQNFLSEPLHWKEHLNWYSPVIRLSLRLSVLLLTGYLVINQFSSDQYSYWCLLTIVIVTRPVLAMTWQRNIQRIIGTIVGVLIAFGLVYMLGSPVILLSIATAALFGFFVWNRTKYERSVICITVGVILCLHLYHGSLPVILTARIGYTLLGCLLGLAGMYLFPVWVGAQLPGLLDNAIDGNRLFLAAVIEAQPQQRIRLARKYAHEQLAHLAEAIRRTRPEPGKRDIAQVEHIQILNYRINAVITSLFLAPGKPTGAGIRQMKLALRYLQQDVTIESQKERHGLLKGAALLEKLTRELCNDR